MNPKIVFFTFGRMNPPTKGHEKLIQHMVNEARKVGANAVIGMSKTRNKIKNPLRPENKLAILNKMFPGVPKIADKTIGAVMKQLGNSGYTNLRLIVGQNRMGNFTFVTKGPSLARSSSNVSATKARNAAMRGNAKLFKKYMSNKLTNLNLTSISGKIYSALSGSPTYKEKVSPEKITRSKRPRTSRRG